MPPSRKRLGYSFHACLHGSIPEEEHACPAVPSNKIVVVVVAAAAAAASCAHACNASLCRTFGNGCERFCAILAAVVDDVPGLHDQLWGLASQVKGLRVWMPCRATWSMGTLVATGSRKAIYAGPSEVLACMIWTCIGKGRAAFPNG